VVRFHSRAISMKKQHIYLKLNLVTFLNKRIYTCFLVFNKSLEVLKRDLFFYKIWTYTKLNLGKQKNIYLEKFDLRYKLK
jgi:hypothetical protein